MSTCFLRTGYEVVARRPLVSREQASLPSGRIAVGNSIHVLTCIFETRSPTRPTGGRRVQSMCRGLTRLVDREESPLGKNATSVLRGRRKLPHPTTVANLISPNLCWEFLEKKKRKSSCCSSVHAFFFFLHVTMRGSRYLSIGLALTRDVCHHQAIKEALLTKQLG